MRMSSSKVERHKCQPDDAGGVHGEANILGLVEIIRNLSCLDGVNSTNSDQDHAVHLDTVELFI